MSSVTSVPTRVLSKESVDREIAEIDTGVATYLPLSRFSELAADEVRKNVEGYKVALERIKTAILENGITDPSTLGVLKIVEGDLVLLCSRIERAVRETSTSRAGVEVSGSCSSRSLDTACGGSGVGSSSSSSSSSSSKKEEAVRSLCTEADGYFRDLAPLTPVTCVWSEGAFSSDKQILHEIIAQGFPGMCIGESHSDANPKKFLIDNMEIIQALGITTLYLEHLFHDTMQPLLNAYFSASSPELPPPLANYLAELDLHFKCDPRYSYTALVKKAKACGVAVVGIDTSLSYELCKDPGLIFDRIRAMNFVATKIIAQESEKRPGKFIVLTGSAHALTLGYKSTPDADKEITVAGMAEQLRCPSILIQDSIGEASVETGVRDIRFLTGALKYTHLVLTRSAPVKPIS